MFFHIFFVSRFLYNLRSFFTSYILNLFNYKIADAMKNKKLSLP